MIIVKLFLKMCTYFHVISDICTILYLREVRVQKKTMKKLFVLLTLLAIILTSCDASKRMQKRLDKYCQLCPSKDSTITVIEYKDKIVTIPGDTTVVVDSLYCDSLGNVYIKRLSEKDGELTRLKQNLKDNKLTSTVIVKTQYVNVPGVTVTKTRDVIKTLPAKEVKYVPWYINFLAVLGGITFIFIIIYIIYKLTLGKWTQRF